MLRAPITLSHLSFDVLWRHNGLGEGHTALSVPSPGETDDERTLVESEAFDRLARAGLAGSQARQDIRDALRLIAKADKEFFGWVANGPGEPRAIVVAADAREAVLVVREPEVIRLAPVDSTWPVEAMVRQLPEVPAGRGQSINVREADFKGGVQGQARREDPDARALRRLLAEPRAGLSKLYAARRDANGGRRRASDFLTVLDVTGNGRWLITTQTDSAGQRWVTANPGTPQGIVDKLHRLHNALN